MRFSPLSVLIRLVEEVTEGTEIRQSFSQGSPIATIEMIYNRIRQERIIINKEGLYDVVPPLYKEFGQALEETGSIGKAREIMKRRASQGHVYQCFITHSVDAGMIFNHLDRIIQNPDTPLPIINLAKSYKERLSSSAFDRDLVRRVVEIDLLTRTGVARSEALDVSTPANEYSAEKRVFNSAALAKYQDLTRVFDFEQRISCLASDLAKRKGKLLSSGGSIENSLQGEIDKLPQAGRAVREATERLKFLLAHESPTTEEKIELQKNLDKLISQLAKMQFIEQSLIDSEIEHELGQIELTPAQTAKKAA